MPYFIQYGIYACAFPLFILLAIRANPPTRRAAAVTGSSGSSSGSVGGDSADTAGASAGSGGGGSSGGGGGGNGSGYPALPLYAQSRVMVTAVLRRMNRKFRAAGAREKRA
jgi:hypothetical protein